MIRDTRSGQPRQAALLGAADTNRCHRCRRFPPHLHRAMIAATLAIAAVSALAAVARVLLVAVSAAANAVSP